MKKIMLMMIYILVLTACVPNPEKTTHLLLFDPEITVEQIQITDLTTNQTQYFEFETLDTLIPVIQDIQELEKTEIMAEEAVMKWPVTAEYQVRLIGIAQKEVSRFQLSASHHVRFDGIWYNNPLFQSALDIIRESYIQSIYSKWPHGQEFASYLNVPSNLSVQNISDLNIKSQEGNHCNYRDILRMDVSLIKELCYLVPASIIEDRVTFAYQLDHVDGLSSLFNQLYQAMFQAEPVLDQEYSHLLSKMLIAPEEDYRKRVITSTYKETYQCGFDIGAISLDELIREAKYIVRIKATNNSTSFLREERWPDQFSVGDDMVYSSFPFVVVESYYGDLQIGDAGELLYFGGVHHDKLMDCAGTYEDYAEGEEFLLLGKESIVPLQQDDNLLFTEVHFLHDSLMKIDSKQRIQQSIDWRKGRYFNSGVDVNEVVEFIIRKKSSY